MWQRENNKTCLYFVCMVDVLKKLPGTLTASPFVNPKCFPWEWENQWNELTKVNTTLINIQTRHH